MWRPRFSIGAERKPQRKHIATTIIYSLASQSLLYTVYIQIFEGRNFHCFRGQLIIRENFILEISLLNLVCINRRAARIHVIWLYSSGGSLEGGWRLVGANHDFHFILHGYTSGFWYIRGQFRYIKLQTLLEVVGNILSKILSHVAGCNHDMCDICEIWSAGHPRK